MHTVNPRSLENLKLGGQSRSRGKIRRTYTLLPETVEWLTQSGNASNCIDELVKCAMVQDLDEAIAQPMITKSDEIPSFAAEASAIVKAMGLPPTVPNSNRSSRRKKKRGR